MNLEKLKPWNWFKHEETGQENTQQIPVTRNEASPVAPATGADSLMRLHREMDQLFDNVFNAFGMPGIRSSLLGDAPARRGASFLGGTSLLDSPMGSTFTPSIDVSGDESQYEITLDVPGMSQDDLSIEINGDVLSIKGSKEENTESKDKHFYRVERRYGSFQRTLALPEDANADDMSATMKDGVLRLVVPRKALPKADVKRIPISS